MSTLGAASWGCISHTLASLRDLVAIQNPMKLPYINLIYVQSCSIATLYIFIIMVPGRKKQKIAGSTGWSCHTAALTLRPRFVPITLQAKCAKSCPLEAQVLHGVDDSLFMATQCYTCHGINYSGLYTIVWAWLKYIRKLTHTILMILVILVIDQEMELSEIMGQNLECIIHPLWGVNKS